MHGLNKPSLLHLSLTLSISRSLSLTLCIMASNADTNFYEDIIKKNIVEVLKHCQGKEEGPFHVITIHGDTVLHVALYSRQFNLVTALLELIVKHPEKGWACMMGTKNDAGNTILHEAATSDKSIKDAEKMLLIAPQLLHVDNNFQEKAIFRAASDGQSKMFQFLDRKINESLNPDGQAIAADRQKTFYESYHQRKDKDNNIIGTILHAAVEAEDFELALSIANKYQYLVDLEDMKGMTPLQMLASKTWTFRNSGRADKCLRRLFPCGNSTEDVKEEGQSWCLMPTWSEKLENNRWKYESAVKLAALLVENDTSWKKTSPLDRQPDQPSSNAGQRKPKTPLFLAAESGAVEIVVELLKKHPQAVEHIDNEGRTILHIAIKNRHLEILDIMEMMKIPIERLIRKVDNQKNSILHMVGEGEVDPMIESGKTILGVEKNPALQLQNDLLLFERIDRMCPPYFFQHQNEDGETAEKLFARKKEKHLSVAVNWLKRAADNCIIVAVLVATAAFAAAYTVPGGPNQNTGYPILLEKAFFIIFAIADVLSLTFALTSVIVFLTILTSSFRLNEFKKYLPQRLMLGVSFLIFSVSMMMLAFGATVMLLVHNKQKWTIFALYVVAILVLPVYVFAQSYMPLCLSQVEAFMYAATQLVFIFPRFNFARLVKSFREIKNECVPSFSNTRNQGGAAASSSLV